MQQTPERVGQSDAVYEVVSLQREAERFNEEKGHLTSPAEEEEAEEGTSCYGSFFPASFSDLSCFSSSGSNTQTKCFPISPVSCAAGMQASQATIVAVRLQPFAYMTQFQLTNINRSGIFPWPAAPSFRCCNSGLVILPSAHSRTSRTSLFVLSFSTVLTVSHSALSQSEALTGMIRVVGGGSKKAPL